MNEFNLFIAHFNAIPNFPIFAPFCPPQRLSQELFHDIKLGLEIVRTLRTIAIHQRPCVLLLDVHDEYQWQETQMENGNYFFKTISESWQM